MTPILQISTDEKFASSVAYLKRRLQSLVTSGEVVVAVEKDKARTRLVVGSVDIDKSKPSDPKVMALVKRVAACAIDAIADVVVTDCKFYYIATRLRLPIKDDICRHAFIKALSTFDRDTDKLIAKGLIKLTPNFFLDSFYDFMTDPLKTRWQEVCTLANENTAYLMCGTTFSELLRFLISNIESLSEEAHLFAEHDKVEVFGKGKRPFKNIYINEELPQDVQVVTKLIAIAPKKIFLHEETKPLGEGLVRNIQDLFGNSVVIVSG